MSVASSEAVLRPSYGAVTEDFAFATSFLGSSNHIRRISVRCSSTAQVYHTIDQVRRRMSTAVVLKWASLTSELFLESTTGVPLSLVACTCKQTSTGM